MVRRFLISLSAASGILAIGFEKTISNIGKSGSADNATTEVVFPKANFVDQRAPNWEQSSPLANKKCASWKGDKTESVPLPTAPEQNNEVIHSESSNPAPASFPTSVPYHPQTPSAPPLSGEYQQPPRPLPTSVPYNPQTPSAPPLSGEYQQTQTRPIGWVTNPV